MPSPSAPHPPAQAAPILNFRGIDEDIDAVPPPPPMIYVGRPASRGRSLTAQLRSVAMPVIPESPISRTVAGEKLPSSPTDGDFIPIMHKRIPEKIQTKNLDVPQTPSDDGYTPITPAPSMFTSSPRLKTKVPPLPSPRDALGIPISKVKFLTRSRGKNSPVSPSNEEDLEPLSPYAAQASSLPVPVVQQGKKRRTVWGVLEGWWDLGLLDRSKSFRRK